MQYGPSSESPRPSTIDEAAGADCASADNGDADAEHKAALSRRNTLRLVALRYRILAANFWLGLQSRCSASVRAESTMHEEAGQGATPARRLTRSQ